MSRYETEGQSYAGRTFDVAFFEGTFESNSARGAMLNPYLCTAQSVVYDGGCCNG